MKWGFQINKWNPETKEHQWLWVAPAGCTPYEYDTEEEAYSRMNMCYPGQVVGTDVRTKERP